jgi:uncharacterized membrane protein YhaH (DUF805 family)
MDWTWYLFGFKGRINPAKFWLSFLILFGWIFFIGWMMYFSFLLVARAGYLHDEPVRIAFGIDAIIALMGRASHFSLSLLDVISLAANLFGLSVFMWICLATAIKRLHDRDRSGWWIVPFFVAPSVTQYLQDWLPALLLTVFGPILFILCIWGFIEMAFLRGSPSINRFGPNPLGKRQSRRRSERGSGFGTSGWDQTGEIELAPHIGSPPAGMRVKRGP